MMTGYFSQVLNKMFSASINSNLTLHLNSATNADGYLAGGGIDGICDSDFRWLPRAAVRQEPMVACPRDC
jgi:hypothetical protein